MIEGYSVVSRSYGFIVLSTLENVKSPTFLRTGRMMNWTLEQQYAIIPISYRYSYS